MKRHTAKVSEVASGALRRLDRRLHIDHTGQSEWIWAGPILVFAATLAIFVAAGVMSGVWAAEYIPTGLVIALVISGLLVACRTPEAEPPEDEHGDGGHHTEPSPFPPPLDPGVWLRLLVDADVHLVHADDERNNHRLREPAGAPR